jgi:hypothetical protein
MQGEWEAREGRKRLCVLLKSGRFRQNFNQVAHRRPSPPRKQQRAPPVSRKPRQIRRVLRRKEAVEEPAKGATPGLPIA